MVITLSSLYMIIVFALFILVLVRKEFCHGETPKNMIWKPDLESDNPYIHTIYTTIEILQYKIDEVKKSNHWRAKMYKYTLIAFYITVLLSIVCVTLLVSCNSSL